MLRNTILCAVALTACGVMGEARLCAQAEPDQIEAALRATRTTPAEMRWRLIPFMPSLRAALALGAEQGKPVFFFGYDGELDTGNS
jgi:hypothetical protein